MRKPWLAALALGVGALLAVTATAPSQDKDRPPAKDRPPRPRPDGRRPPPRFELGRVLPPHLKDELNLSAEQQKQLDKIEKEVKERVLKLLTPAQKKKLEEAIRRGPPRPPRDGGPREGRPRPRDGDRERRPERPEQARVGADQGGIAWFATWEGGLREARRTGRPILLVSAAPHCAGVSGIW